MVSIDDPSEQFRALLAALQQLFMKKYYLPNTSAEALAKLVLADLNVVENHLGSQNYVLNENMRFKLQQTLASSQLATSQPALQDILKLLSERP
jgi:hypothetical protein